MNTFVIKQRPLNRVCPRCGLNLMPDAAVCPQCGENVPPAVQAPAGAAEQPVLNERPVPPAQPSQQPVQPAQPAQQQPVQSVQSAVQQPAAEQAAKPVFCAQCGKKNDAQARFCMACGAKLIRPEGRP